VFDSWNPFFLSLSADADVAPLTFLGVTSLLTCVFVSFVVWLKGLSLKLDQPRLNDRRSTRACLRLSSIWSLSPVPMYDPSA